jgi:hypothetical protein
MSKSKALDRFLVGERLAEQSKARQGKAKQSKARQGKAKQSKARQGKAKQSKAAVKGDWFQVCIDNGVPNALDLQEQATREKL